MSLPLLRSAMRWMVLPGRRDSVRYGASGHGLSRPAAHTATGTVLSVRAVTELPAVPFTQAMTVPLPSTAKGVFAAAAFATAPVSSLTGGDDGRDCFCGAVASSPLAFLPQAMTVPFFSKR